MMEECRQVAAVDIGGTKTAVAIADSSGRMLVRYQRETSQIPEDTLRWVADVIHEWQVSPGQGGKSITAVGAGCPGPLDQVNGVIMKAPNLKQWSGYPLRNNLQEKLGVQVFLENDANLGAVGEHRYGSGVGFQDVVYVTVSTGIGGGLIIQNRLLRGVDSSAGEVGHMTVDPNGPLCGCGSNGCLEALSSGTAIVNAAETLVLKGKASRMLQDTYHKNHPLTAQAIADLADHGDMDAASIIEEAMVHLGIGIANIITVLSPQIVIIGGGIANIGARMFTPVRTQVEKRVRLVPVQKIPIVPAKLMGDSVLYGGVYLSLHGEV